MSEKAHAAVVAENQRLREQPVSALERMVELVPRITKQEATKTPP